MNQKIKISVTILCCCFSIHDQAHAGEASFAGCYRIISAKWHPWNEDASPIPERFQLRNEPMDSRSNYILQMRSIPVTSDAAENLWTWQRKGDSLWLSWGTGFGGFRGTLKQFANGEFVGKVKEWCDSRCGWKVRKAKLRIVKTECP